MPLLSHLTIFSSYVMCSCIVGIYYLLNIDNNNKRWWRRCDVMMCCSWWGMFDPLQAYNLLISSNSKQKHIRPLANTISWTLPNPHLIFLFKYNLGVQGQVFKNHFDHLNDQALDTNFDCWNMNYHCICVYDALWIEMFGGFSSTFGLCNNNFHCAFLSFQRNQQLWCPSTKPTWLCLLTMHHLWNM